jgi:branched-chain amino acid transport system substrate-binding protein
MKRALWSLLAAYLCLLAAPTDLLYAQYKTNPERYGISGENYARAPSEFIAYRGFSEPFMWFWAEEQLYLGAGRKKPAPTGLTSVKIGFIGPLEESNEEALGRRMLNGALLAIEEANARGGYRGIPYELLVRNDIGPWGAAANKLVELNDEKVWAVLGSVDGEKTHIALRVALKVELTMVSSGATDPTLTETRIPWYLRVNGDDRQFAYALAWHIYRDLKLDRAALLRVNSRFGRVGVAEFRDSSRRIGKPLVIEQRFAEGATDFTEQIQRLKDSQAQAVVLWGSADELGRIVKQLREHGVNLPVFGNDRMVDPEFLEIAGASAEGAVAAIAYDPGSRAPKHLAFVERYRSRFGEEPETQAAHAYDGMQIIIASIEKAGLNRALIRDEILGLVTFEGVSGVKHFDTRWDNVAPVYLMQVKDGRFRTIGSPAW